MDNRGIEPLDYAPAAESSRNRLVGWLAFLFLVIQVIWALPAVWWSLDLLENGQAKEPLYDFLINIVIVLPSIAAMVVGLLDCLWQWRRKGYLRECKLSLFSVLVGAALVAFVVYGWIDEDVVNRSIPHGFW